MVANKLSGPASMPALGKSGDSNAWQAELLSSLYQLRCSWSEQVAWPLEDSFVGVAVGAEG